ncbi:MAG: flavohemoglobin expression-modulating QEGLA motif protein [Ignavibacteriaceae bacterium]
MKKSKLDSISDQFITTVCTRLAENKQVRRTLPLWGRLHIDRQLPFLCIYRQLNKEDKSLSERLVMGEASYLTASGNRRLQRQLALLISNIVLTLKKSFGSFLIVEVWVEPDNNAASNLSIDPPTFKIIQLKNTVLFNTIETLEKSLSEIRIRKKTGVVDIVETAQIHPPGLPAIISSAEANQLNCHIIGIEIRPIYRNPRTQDVFPLIHRELQKGFERALRKSFFRFTNDHTTHKPLNYQSLGRWSMVKAVWEVDRQLAEICNGFDFLLQVTPLNNNSAWAAFERNKFERAPKFVYRPLPIDPALAKRRLFEVPIERIEDPTIAQLFREQQLELDRKLTMLIDRGTPGFKYGSFQLYGIVDKSLLKQADEILKQLSPRSRDESAGSSVDAQSFAKRAMQELNYFRNSFPESKSKVMVRDDITGLMVSQGNLLIGKQLKISETRVEALIQHEIGTHVLTYLNGRSQPFRQLYVGLAGYEELQEGLAVLSEFLVGGLTSPRLRLLAARVLAAHLMIDGASFVEVFRELNKGHGFERRTTFTITMRTFRCGGLTKDAVYLRGLVQLLDYIKKGGKLESLFVGKIAAKHIAIVQELMWRKVLHPPPLQPRYFRYPQTAEKLDDLKNGLTLLNLVKRRTK